MSKMKNCKVCGNQIAKGVNKCVHCGKDQRNFFMKHKIITIILGLVILGGIGSGMGGDKDNATKTSTASTKETTQSKSAESKKEDPVYKVGDVIKTDKFEVTIVSIEEKAQVGGEYIKKTPSEGGTYIAVQFQYKNISDKPVGSFSKPSINLTDKSGTKYKADIDASSTFATEVNPDRKIVSDLNPGITVKDADVFEISKDSYSKGGWKLLVAEGSKKANININ
ncbi:DUF4352 domain-containing protein [Clostridium magnum]|uniref:Telomeric repeat-binding factor 2 n=1 Tax=Clostridium magnum DSM 2767 TaxID=1121326 RepID=A0A161XG65_9CLOT|nr:DUF4352 domain-containing protein [Clostridium magnum]KZL93576.1 telomeric repeat-binding factor 2 [Clostridium magnum DSM 2767]SHI59631.1 protein of unknown function [Clostridium magnum DSM 2767]